METFDVHVTVAFPPRRVGARVETGPGCEIQFSCVLFFGCKTSRAYTTSYQLRIGSGARRSGGLPAHFA